MRKVIVGIFLLLGLLIFRPLLNNQWYPVHDTTSVVRTFLLERSLSRSSFPAVWASELNDGKGYPLFHFYAPLSTYLSLVGKVITTSYFVGIKVMLILACILGMAGMYLLARRWGRGPGVLTAVSYALLPYAAVNLYVRGAYAEYLSMSLLPWLFLSWDHLVSRRDSLRAALVSSLFLLSHNLIPMLTAPFLAAFLLFRYWRHPKIVLLPILVCLGLSAFFLLPLVFERNFVQADAVAKTTSYSLHFVAPSQLWNSVWGYGGSAAGVEDGMSFKLGKLHLLLAGLALLGAILKRQKHLIVIALAALFSLFMTTSYSALLWAHFPLLPLAQFPWRYLTLAGFFISLLTGFSLTLIPWAPLRSLMLFILVVAQLTLNLKYFVPKALFPADLTQFTSPAYLQTVPQIVPEYAPIWLNIKNKVGSNSTIIPVYYYPTWKVTLNDRVVKTYPASGYLAFDNPTVSTNYSYSQSHTPLELFATYLSLFTLILGAILYVKT